MLDAGGAVTCNGRAEYEKSIFMFTDAEIEPLLPLVELAPMSTPLSMVSGTTFILNSRTRCCESIQTVIVPDSPPESGGVTE